MLAPLPFISASLVPYTPNVAALAFGLGVVSVAGHTDIVDLAAGVEKGLLSCASAAFDASIAAS